MNTTDQTIDLEQLVLEHTKLTDDIAALTERRDTIKHLLAKHLPDGGNIAGHVVQVTRPRRLDPKALEQAYPVAQHPELYRPALDTAAVKKHIAEVELDAFKIEGRPSVTVK